VGAVCNEHIVIDKEFQDLIPPLASEELIQLETNIKENGCRDPLVLWNSVLIDGHNRYRICKDHGIDFRTVKQDFADRSKAILWMIDNQFGRRNLADIDRIKLARKREDVLRPIASKNQKQSLGQGKKGLAKLPDLKPVDTRKEVAKTAGVGERTYDAGKLILDAAANGEIDQETVEKVRRKETTIHRVAKDIKEKRTATKREEQRKEAVAKTDPQFFDNVHVGDFRNHFDKVENGSLSLIFTDPPYDRESEKLFDGLGEFAANKLCDGGSLLCYVGHIQIPKAIEDLSKHLRYWWVVCCLHSGGNSLMREYGIRVGWKAVLWFVKGTRADKQNILFDVVSGGREKTHHDWQQSQSEAEYWIENLCGKNEVVCDPFLGGGTTVAAAMKLNRKWIAFEKDHDQAVLAMTRCKT